MPDPTTTNRSLFVPTRGSDVGTWDVPVNANENLIDTIVGGIVIIPVTNTNVTLNSTQYANGTIVVTGTLTGSVAIIFPAVQGWWSILNQTTNSGGVSFALYAASVGGANKIGCPPGEHTFFQVNGTTGVNYVNLDRVGSYLDLARSTVPLWISGSTVPPYLNCDGTTFSAVTYPALADVLGGTTLPDLRGRARFYLNGGTNRINTGGSGIDGDTILSTGGDQNVPIQQTNLPAIRPTGTVSRPTITVNSNVVGLIGLPQTTGGLQVFLPGGSSLNIAAALDSDPVFTGNFLGSGTNLNKMPPTQISGLCLIRAA